MLVVSPGLPGIKIKGACLKNQRKAPLISPLLQPTLVQQLKFLLPSWFTHMYCINVPTMYKHRTPFGSMPNSASHQHANSTYEHTTHRFKAIFLKFWTLHNTFQIITVTKKALKKSHHCVISTKNTLQTNSNHGSIWETKGFSKVKVISFLL